MANHVRKQLRDALKTALTNLTTTGARVYGRRLYAVQQGTELPCLSIYITDEAGDDITVHAPATRERQPTVIVRGMASAAADVEDALDTIAKEVETALASGVVVGSKRITLRYQGMDVEAEAGEKPFGAIDLRFTCSLFNSANTPDSLT